MTSFYLKVWWKGRLLKDFLHKKDAMTVSSYINSEFSDTESTAGKKALSLLSGFVVLHLSTLLG